MMVVVVTQTYRLDKTVQKHTGACARETGGLGRWIAPAPVSRLGVRPSRETRVKIHKVATTVATYSGESFLQLKKEKVMLVRPPPLQTSHSVPQPNRLLD